MSVDPLRHLAVFSPMKFGNRRVDIIGVGATGSRVALSLAKLGVYNLHIWDFDTVEEHNLANQVYGLQDVGQAKVAALSKIIKRDVAVDVMQHCESVDGSQPLGEVIFLLTDTMASRRQIWGGIKFRAHTKLMIETRMGTDNGRVYAINPCNTSDIAKWEETLCGDDEAEVSHCGGSISVGPTADILAGLACWQFVNWSNWVQGNGQLPESEQIFAVRTLYTLARRF
jgi:hypothetical protein